MAMQTMSTATPAPRPAAAEDGNSCRFSVYELINCLSCASEASGAPLSVTVQLNVLGCGGRPNLRAHVCESAMSEPVEGVPMTGSIRTSGQLLQGDIRSSSIAHAAADALTASSKPFT
eukprot:5875228-Prymnesium_polylepis.2